MISQSDIGGGGGQGVGSGASIGWRESLGALVNLMEVKGTAALMEKIQNLSVVGAGCGDGTGKSKANAIEVMTLLGPWFRLGSFPDAFVRPLFLCAVPHELRLLCTAIDREELLPESGGDVEGGSQIGQCQSTRHVARSSSQYLIPPHLALVADSLRRLPNSTSFLSSFEHRHLRRKRFCSTLPIPQLSTPSELLSKSIVDCFRATDSSETCSSPSWVCVVRSWIPATPRCAKHSNSFGRDS